METSSNKRGAILRAAAFVSLLALLVLELTLRYDTWVRQIALAITNISTILALIIADRYMRRRGVRLPWSVAWFAALGVWFDGMGNFIHYYANIRWWDQLAHAVGSGALAAGVFVLVAMFQRRGTIRLGTKLRALFVVSITTTLSALYEISEYIGDVIYPTNRVTNLFDTADDLLWNLVAAIVVVSFAHVVTRRPEFSPQSGTEKL